MRIALFGATGGTGQEIISQALAAGHKITALVRTPGSLARRQGVVIVGGDASDPAAVAKTLDGSDVAISTLGNFNRKRNTQVSGAMRIIVRAMEDAGPNRLVVVTTIGVGDSYKPLKSFIFKHLVIGLLAKNIWKDRERQEAVIAASSLDWTIARPGALKDTAHTGMYQVVDGGAAQPNKIIISRADVADFCLKAAQDDAFITKTVCLFY